jgi:two-component system response regulator FixJ
LTSFPEYSRNDSKPISERAMTLKPASRPVIVVEDDGPLREALKLTFEVEGFEVKTFSSAEEFLANSEVLGDGCLVLDHKLPGMDGLELVETLRSRGIQLPTVLITTPTATVVRRAAKCGVPLVEKPLLNHGLLNTVRALLGGGD